MQNGSCRSLDLTDLTRITQLTRCVQTQQNGHFRIEENSTIRQFFPKTTE